MYCIMYQTFGRVCLSDLINEAAFMITGSAGNRHQLIRPLKPKTVEFFYDRMHYKNGKSFD